MRGESKRVLADRVAALVRPVTNRYGNYDKGWNEAIQAVLHILEGRASTAREKK